MDKILIINLKRFGDILSSSYLVNSLKAANPTAEIELLIYKEFQPITKIIQNICKVHTIDRKQIISLKQNRIFSDGHALEVFASELMPLKETKWKQVINYSNDYVSSYITSFLTSFESNNFAGLRFSKFDTTEFSNHWAMVFNDVTTSYPYTPTHFLDCYHNICNIKTDTSQEMIITNETHDNVAKDNFNYIREKESLGAVDVKLIGIQLKASNSSKDIPAETLIDFINILLDDPTTYPILLAAPSDEEKNYAASINKHFDNTLITVESDFVAAPSVMKNLDILVTPDTVIKHLADLQKIPTIEVSLGQSPFLKQGSTNPNSLILTPVISSRSWNNKDKKDRCNNISGQDIANAMKCLINPETAEQLQLSPQTSLYRPLYDNMGLKYQLIAGEKSPYDEISRGMGRIYLNSILDEKITKENYDEIRTFGVEAVSEWIEEEKEVATEASRRLLRSIRSLLQAQNSAQHGVAFAESLEVLFKLCSSASLTAIATLILRSKLEALTGTSLANNIKNAEALLYEYKSHVQKTLGCLKHLAKFETVTRATKAEIVI